MKNAARALLSLLTAAVLLCACESAVDPSGSGETQSSGASHSISASLPPPPSPLSASPSAPTPEETPYIPFNDMFYNPLMVGYMLGDPWLTYRDGMYYYTASGGDHASVMPSRTISGLMSNLDQKKNVYLGVYNAQTEIWGNELHHYQGRWYIFYAADYNNDNTLHRMYVLRSLTDDAMGEWEYAGKLDLPDDQWAIDATFFENTDGRIFLIWSGWRNQSEGTSLWLQRLYIAELERGDPTKVVSTERVMISSPTYVWESSVLPQNEGPAVIISPNGTVYCSYAANYSGSDDYCIGLLRLNGDDPMIAENWEKLPEPLLASDKDNEIYGPGHCSFTKSPDGTEDWMIYHAAKASGSGWDRNARAQKVEWIDDTPYIGKPVSLLDPQPLPSGEIVNRILIQAEDCVLVNKASVVDIGTVGQAVHFTGKVDQAIATVKVERDGEYAVYIRHSNHTGLETLLWARANDKAPEVPCIASRSGAEGQFTMTVAILKLSEGLNTIHLTAGRDVDIDLIILDLDPM